MFTLFGKEEDKEAPTLFLYDSKTRELRPFEPLKANEATMYSCGPTVYDHIHIGNLRAYLLPDLIKRVLLLDGYEVNHTVNVTDFGHLSDDADAGEDKMMKALKRNNMPITLEAMHEVAVPYIESFKNDLDVFNILPPTNITRASDYVKKQIELIEELEKKGHTYQTSDGVYFDISSFPRYGELGNVSLDQNKAGARVEVNDEKKHPADFALWKNGELGWESKWGTGFPGWHIECVAMIFDTLGEQIDIHTGGEDLMYTHHNAEITQAESLTGKEPFVGYWLHNAFVTINDAKIAKSEGNGITLTDLIEKDYDPLAFRLLLLQAHYRSPMNFSFEALDAASSAHKRLKHLVYEELFGAKEVMVPTDYMQKITEYAHDDLDTPKLVSLLFEVSKDTELGRNEKYSTMLAIDAILGVGLSEDQEVGRDALGVMEKSAIPPEIHELLEQRVAARVAQNWTEADIIREKIEQKGYTLTDTPTGTGVTKVEK